jgi:hypothetical protein
MSMEPVKPKIRVTEQQLKAIEKAKERKEAELEAKTKAREQPQSELEAKPREQLQFETEEDTEAEILTKRKAHEAEYTAKNFYDSCTKHLHFPLSQEALAMAYALVATHLGLYPQLEFYEKAEHYLKKHGLNRKTIQKNGDGRNTSDRIDKSYFQTHAPKKLYAFIKQLMCHEQFCGSNSIYANGVKQGNAGWHLLRLFGTGQFEDCGIYRGDYNNQTQQPKHPSKSASFE